MVTKEWVATRKSEKKKNNNKNTDNIRSSCAE